MTDPTGGHAQPPRIGLALSGGGFRAAAFHLGVLKRLEELRVLQQVEALSTVSGGSVTGALYALRCAKRGGAPGSFPVEALIAEMRPFLTANLRARALFGTPARALRTLYSVVSRRVSRIGLMVAELDRELFGGATLSQLPPWIVINATNLRTGKGWRFFSDRVGDYLAGATEHTNRIKVSEAVAASAAYPGLTDSFAFATRWEHLRGDLLDEHRWERPPTDKSGTVSRWRERFGEPTGPVVFPLVDGGLYDNEGVNALRGRKISHAILSAVAPPESDHANGFGPGRLMRIVEVMHDRLGAATRQLTHEMTHGVHPADAALAITEIETALRAQAADTSLPDSARAEIVAAADRLRTLADVGMPPRGAQFTASAQVLLHRTDLARNAYAAAARGGYDVPAAYRGLDAALVAELSRVRTDLDALEPEVCDLLIAQGYFLGDFMTKLAMPDVVFADRATRDWYADGLAPTWEPARTAVAAANANRDAVGRLLARAGVRRGVLGRVPQRRLRWCYRMSLAVVVVPMTALLLAPVLWLAFGVWQMLMLFN